MNEETFNMSVRKFLKKVGIKSQREIEKHVNEAIRLDSLQGNEILSAKVVVEIPELGLKTEIDGSIELE